jgi:CubicO group peptidase (beta-lactamase class C family)
MSDLEIHGECDPRFARVRDAFRENFATRNDLGACVAVSLGGRMVVDLWGGFADKARSRPWSKDTIANVFSTTKGLTAILAHRLVDRGVLDLDAPASRYWPELAQAGKEHVLVRWLLSHRAGLPAIRAPLPAEAMFDWSAMTRALEVEEPWWIPGTKHAYHALTFSWLVGETMRRASGKTVGALLREEIAEPLGADVHIGLDAKHDARVADIRNAPPPKPGEPSLAARIMSDTTSMAARAFANPPAMLLAGTVNSRAFRAAELPAVNGHTNARALARIYGAVRSLLSRDSLSRCAEEESSGEDEVLGVPTRFSTGFMLANDGMSIGPRAIGHIGAGGSVAFGDDAAELGFGYVMNKSGGHLAMDPRARALADATYESLGVFNERKSQS